MKSINTFIYVFKKSISSFDYYNDILKVPFKFSLKYFVVLAIFATTATTIQLSNTIFSTATVEINSFFASITTIFPEDLEIKIENGQMTTNKSQPIVIENSKEVLEQNPNLPKNFIVIDENGVIDDMKNKNTIMLLNKNNVLISQGQNIETINLAELPNTTINKTTLTDGSKKIAPFIKLVPYIMLVITFVTIFAYYFGLRLIYLIGIAAFLFGFSLATKKRLGFAKLYQFSIHAMTAPLVVEVAMSLGGFGFEHAFWFPILNIIIALVGITRLAHNSQ